MLTVFSGAVATQPSKLIVSVQTQNGFFSTGDDIGALKCARRHGAT